MTDVGPGDRSSYRVDGELVPDPASRFQPEGPVGPSEIVDPDAFVWQAASWRGAQLEGQVIYELHIGTFTPGGTWRSALARLPELARTGISIVEVMPVGEFAGRFGWGYDGVFPFAPTRLYGTPDDFRVFVDGAPRAGLAVVLDVVYNHLGPSGCALRTFSDAYFTTRYENEWADAIDFDGEQSAPVREYFAANAAYWIEEFRLDGLWLDVTQSKHDPACARCGLSPGNRLGVARRSVRRRLAEDRSRRPGGRPARMPRGLRRASRGARHRHDQRDLRCGAPPLRR
ncbi:MAG TPA: hypothetical protein VNI78_08270, partial [Vicinamibacterales bacterium]|nr:hypothetical protein [Vicinamibacterales bacterium]